jgi:hypothetical protein
MKRVTTLRRIEGLEKGYSAEKSRAVRGRGRRTLVTWEEFQCMAAARTKCQELDEPDAKVLKRAHYLLTGLRL